MTTRRNTGGFEKLLPFPSLGSFPDIFKFSDNPDMVDLSFEIDKFLEFYSQEIFGLGHLKSLEKCPDMWLNLLGELTGTVFPPESSEREKRRRIKTSISDIVNSGIWDNDSGDSIRDILDDITGWQSFIVAKDDENLWLEHPVYVTQEQQTVLAQLDYYSLEVSPDNPENFIGLNQLFTSSAAGQAGFVLIDLGAPDPALITPALLAQISGRLDLFPAFFEIWIGYINADGSFVKIIQIGLGAA